jgi:hypothetical protein
MITLAATTTTQTRAQRMQLPVAIDVLVAAAGQHGVCIRPFTLQVSNPGTAETRYVPTPCGATLESVCGPCARKARALRMTNAARVGT